VPCIILEATTAEPRIEKPGRKALFGTRRASTNRQFINNRLTLYLIQAINRRITVGVAQFNGIHVRLERDGRNCIIGFLIMSNLYPYWESVSIDLAISSLDSMYQQVKAIAGGKRIIVSETGWPSTGNAKGNAVPSPENASSYFYDFVSWALDHSVDYFYFEAFDESWKGSDGYWGVWDKWGQIKPGRENVFIPCESNRPGIEFTHIPLYGSNNDRLQGQVCHVTPSNYGIAVYIYVPGYGWVNKPTWDAPITPINPNGSWNSIVVSGGADQNATMLAAFLLPTGYNPPLLGGSQTLDIIKNLNYSVSAISLK